MGDRRLRRLQTLPWRCRPGLAVTRRCVRVAWRRRLCCACVVLTNAVIGRTLLVHGALVSVCSSAASGGRGAPVQGAGVVVGVRGQVRRRGCVRRWCRATGRCCGAPRVRLDVCCTLALPRWHGRCRVRAYRASVRFVARRPDSCVRMQSERSVFEQEMYVGFSLSRLGRSLMYSFEGDVRSDLCLARCWGAAQLATAADHGAVCCCALCVDARRMRCTACCLRTRRRVPR